MIQFWFLWIFIAIVVVIVAFTLRRRGMTSSKRHTQGGRDKCRKHGASREDFPVGVFLVGY